MPGWRPLALATLVAAACRGDGAAGATTFVVDVPARAATAGEALLARLPPGAELVVEIDLARLRANPVVGAVATAVLASPPALGELGELGAPGAAAPLDGARALVLAAYRVGTPEATTLTVVEGGRRPAGAIELGDERWALVEEGAVAALLATDGGPGLEIDRELLALRAWAMPAAADGASLRVTARLSPAARAALAAALGVDAAPATLSVWGDVADDLAVIARLADAPPAPRPRWLPALVRLRDRAAAAAAVTALGLGPPIAAADIRRDDGGVRVAVVVSPGRLRRAVARWRAASIASSAVAAVSAPSTAALAPGSP